MLHLQILGDPLCMREKHNNKINQPGAKNVGHATENASDGSSSYFDIVHHKTWLGHTKDRMYRSKNCKEISKKENRRDNNGSKAHKLQSRQYSHRSPTHLSPEAYILRDQSAACRLIKDQ